MTNVWSHRYMVKLHVLGGPRHIITQTHSGRRWQRTTAHKSLGPQAFCLSSSRRPTTWVGCVTRWGLTVSRQDVDSAVRGMNRRGKYADLNRRWIRFLTGRSAEWKFGALTRRGLNPMLFHLTTRAFNRLYQPDSSPNYQIYYYAELAVSSLIDVTVANVHCAMRMPRKDGRWPGWVDLVAGYNACH